MTIRYDTIMMPILKAYFTQRGLIRIFGKSRKNWGKGSFPRVDRKRERERGGKGKKDNSIILSFKTLMWTIVVQVIYDVLTCLGRTAHGLAAWRIDGASKFLSPLILIKKFRNERIIEIIKILRDQNDQIFNKSNFEYWKYIDLFYRWISKNWMEFEKEAYF